jgi:hypothetical protein
MRHLLAAAAALFLTFSMHPQDPIRAKPVPFEFDPEVVASTGLSSGSITGTNGDFVTFEPSSVKLGVVVQNPRPEVTYVVAYSSTLRQDPLLSVVQLDLTKGAVLGMPALELTDEMQAQIDAALAGDLSTAERQIIELLLRRPVRVELPGVLDLDEGGLRYYQVLAVERLPSGANLIRGSRTVALKRG